MLPKTINIKKLQQHLQKPQILLNIMIRESLTTTFKQEQWEQINRCETKIFLKAQNNILETLIFNIDLFNRYFSIFYQNHVKLYHWFLLSRHMKSEMEGYIFKKLLQLNLNDYKDKAIQIQNTKEKEKFQKRCRLVQQFDKAHSGDQSPSKKQKNRKTTINEYTQQIFNFLSSKGTTSSLQFDKKSRMNFTGRKTISNNKQKFTEALPNNITQIQFKKKKKTQNQSSQNSKESDEKLNKNINSSSAKSMHDKQNKNKKSVDFHDLYMKTFHACDGFRYIFYNYEKHMKGISQKDKYNMFIRSKSNRKQPNNKLITQSIRNTAESPLFSDNRDFRAQQPQQERALKTADNFNQNSIYQYHQFGTFDDSLLNTESQFPPNKTTSKGFEKVRNQVIFKRIRHKNQGVFIRR